MWAGWELGCGRVGSPSKALHLHRVGHQAHRRFQGGMRRHHAGNQHMCSMCSCIHDDGGLGVGAGATRRKHGAGYTFAECCSGVHAYAMQMQTPMQRLLGKRVRFVTGTDEHGEKIAMAAAARGMSPQEHCDDIVREYKALWQQVGEGWGLGAWALCMAYMRPFERAVMTCV